MGSHQEFCLRWNNHQSNLLNVFEELLERETLVDVTLACEGLSLKAHKVVLSACSPFFQNLFASNPCKHPIVILKDVKYADLKSVVDFMYRGEINVIHDQLDALLKVADTLQVKGLAEVTEKICLKKIQATSHSFSSTISNGNVNGRSEDGFNSKRTKHNSRFSAQSISPNSSKRRKKAKVVVAQKPPTIKTEKLSDTENVNNNNNDLVNLPAGPSQIFNQIEQSLVVASHQENSLVNDEESSTELPPFTNEHLSNDIATSSIEVSDLPLQVLDCDEDEYYPSNSLGAIDNSMSGDSSLSTINKENGEVCESGPVNGKWICEMCGRTYDVYTSYSRHVKQSVCSGNIIRCPYCFKRFSRKDSLRRHVVAFHKCHQENG